VFNMKGESLFFLDCDSEDWLKADEADRQMWSSMYAAMGLDPEWKFPLDNILYCGIPKGVSSRLLEEPDIKSRSDAFVNGLTILSHNSLFVSRGFKKISP